MAGVSEPGGDDVGAVGAVIAGGRGSRLGGGKALVELAGRPLISYPLAAVEAAGLRPLVVAKPGTELPPLRCPVIREDLRPRHPLCGVLAALELAGPAPVVVVACDMPFVSAPLLAWLAAQPQPLVAPVRAGRALPFPARYERSLQGGLRRALAAQSSMAAALAALSPRLLDEAELAAHGDPEWLCFNVNTPADLSRAEDRLDSPSQD